MARSCTVDEFTPCFYSRVGAIYIRGGYEQSGATKPCVTCRQVQPLNQRPIAVYGRSSQVGYQEEQGITCIRGVGMLPNQVPAAGKITWRNRPVPLTANVCRHGECKLATAKIPPWSSSATRMPASPH